MGFAMDDFYDEYRSGFGAMALSPDAVDAVRDGLLRDDAPREAIEILNALDMLPEPVRSQNRKNLVWLLRFATRLRRMDDCSEDDNSNSQPMECIELHDPDYSPALAALRGTDGDTKPIARLLKSGVPIPDWIGRDLGIMLDPSDAYRGNALIVKVAPNWQKFLPTQIAKRDIGDRVRLLMAAGEKYDNAIDAVVVETGKSRTWVKECYRMDNAALVRVSQGMLGYDDDDVTN